MQKLVFIIITLLITIPAYSQRVADNTYWFYFTDKENNSYSVNNPEEFLSARSIDRRAWQSLHIDETDLPVTQSYIDSLAKLNLEIKHVSKWLNGVLLISNDAVLIDTLSNISFIDTIAWKPSFEMIYIPGTPSTNRFEPALDAPPSYGYGYAYGQVSQVGTDFLHQSGFTGAGVHIAVLDNGFTKMPELKGFEKSFNQGLILDQRNYADRSKDVYGDYFHGTNVASIIAGNWTDTLIGSAPDASLILAVTENGTSETKIEEFAWIEAAEWADSLGADIINTSLSYSLFDDSATNYAYEDMDGKTAYISRAASLLADKGVLGVTSAGNSGHKDWHYVAAPADAANILTVGAVDNMGNIARFSSRGPSYDHRIKPEIVAWGVLNAVLTVYDTVSFHSGTSFSSPLISGSAASLWQAYPSLTVKDLIRVIIESSDRKMNPDINYGYGLPNFGKALSLISAAPTSNVSQELKAYPNPFKEILYVELPLAYCGEYQITIFDLQGRTVHSSHESIPGRIALSGSIPSGIYLIELKKSGKAFRSRLIKY